MRACGQRRCACASRCALRKTEDKPPLLSRLDAAGEDAADFGNERVRRARLGDEPIAAGASGALQLARPVVGGKRDHRDVGSALVGLEAARRLPAIDHTTQHAPDVVLMDLSLPVIDGWEATRRVKANPATAKIPVIALTAHAMSQDKEKALAAGCDDFDTKPVELQRLLEKINSLLNRK